MKTALQQITTIAKQLRNKKPSLAWKDCIVKASAEYKKKHKAVGAIKKKAAKKAPVKKAAALLHNTKTVKTFELEKVGTLGSLNTLAGIDNLKRELTLREHYFIKVGQVAILLKKPGTTQPEKNRLRKAETYYKKMLLASNKHITALKKLL